MARSAPTLAPIADADLAAELSHLVAASKDARHPDGGKTKFNADVLTRLCAAFHVGHTIPDACVYAGVSTSTYDEWLRKGRAGEHPYDKLVTVIQRLNLSVYEPAVKRFKEDAEKDWKAAQQFLKTRAPEQWGGRGEESNANLTVQIGTFVLEGGPAED